MTLDAGPPTDESRPGQGSGISSSGSESNATPREVIPR